MAISIDLGVTSERHRLRCGSPGGPTICRMGFIVCIKVTLQLGITRRRVLALTAETAAGVLACRSAFKGGFLAYVERFAGDVEIQTANFSSAAELTGAFTITGGFLFMAGPA